MELNLRIGFSSFKDITNVAVHVVVDAIRFSRRYFYSKEGMGLLLTPQQIDT